MNVKEAALAGLPRFATSFEGKVPPRCLQVVAVAVMAICQSEDGQHKELQALVYTEGDKPPGGSERALLQVLRDRVHNASLKATT